MGEISDVTWRKATKSGNGGDCVELAYGPDGRALGMIRDSKNPERGHLAATSAMLGELLASAKRGDLDLGR